MRRLHDSRGFTLIEMLLVVAVVSILAAVSIPLASSALDKTRCATDAANERAAKGLASTLHFLGEIEYFDSTNAEGSETATFYLYDADSGKLVKRTGSMSGPGGMSAYSAYGQSAKHSHTGCYLWIRVFQDGTVGLAWNKTPGGTSAIVWDTNLCGAHILSGT